MKRKITFTEVEHVASLANLPLITSEIKKFAEQLSEVIGYNMSLLTEVDTKDVEPMAHITGITNVLRPDETEPGLTTPEALQNTVSKHNDFFKVKAIFDLPDGKAGQD
jgi:aspartyl/glutamyl-tRNA(Asn/Gln) amidotransferase C subunit